LFTGATEVLANYRRLLGVKTTVPEELAKIPGESKPKAPAKSKMMKPLQEQK
jgi:hypothetical protein